MEPKILKQAVLNSLLAFLYVAAVGLFMSHASSIFGQQDTTFTPVAAIMLLVFSAALMGILIFGQPLMWYIDGKKKAALSLLGYTMGGLLIFMIVAFIFILLP